MEKKKHIGELLVEYGLVTPDDLQEALRRQQDDGRMLGVILVEMGSVTTEDIDWVLSKQLNIPFIIVDKTLINPELLARFPKDFLMIHRIIPLYESDTEIAIVTDDPFNRNAFEQIEQKLGKTVTLSTGSGDDIDDILQQAFSKEGVPEIISQMESLIKRIENTCLYRLDFMIRSTGMTINAYGFGIRRQMYEDSAEYQTEDVMKALRSMNLGFVHESFQGDGGTFLSVFPLVKKIQPLTYPLVLGTFGLCIPEGTAFTDLRPSGVDTLFQNSAPVDGYSFLSARKHSSDGRDRVIYTLDSAPDNFGNAHVVASLPRECPSCSGAGCSECNFLGLVFREIDGVYSYADLIGIMKEG